jgi:hypothetical protein
VGRDKALAVPPSGYDATLQRTPLGVYRSRNQAASPRRNYQWIPREVRSLPKLLGYASRGWAVDGAIVHRVNGTLAVFDPFRRF